jgi:hypothetical protein
MRSATFLLTLGLCLTMARSAAPRSAAAGGEAPPTTAGPCLTDADRAAIRERLARNLDELRASGRLAAPDRAAVVAFGWPLRVAPRLADFGFHGISNFVDQNPANPGAVLDYQCGSRTYDVSGYNHKGTDMFTWPFGWYKMDHSQVEVVAAAPGIITGKDDGNYDRRRGWSGYDWNAVYVQHADGSSAWHAHLGGPPRAPPGVYFAQLHSGAAVRLRKLVVAS